MLHSPNRAQLQYAILPPPTASISKVFRRVVMSPQRHRELLEKMQRFRGRIYASDNAVRPDELTADGRHRVPSDEQSWHVLALDEEARVVACLRYTDEVKARGFDDLFERHA